MANKNTCAGCGATIIWIGTIGKRAMPCDPKQVTYWNTKKGHTTIVTPNGETIAKAEIEGDLQKATGIGYIPHWATCPVAGKFKKAPKGGCRK